MKTVMAFDSNDNTIWKVWKISKWNVWSRIRDLILMDSKNMLNEGLTDQDEQNIKDWVDIVYDNFIVRFRPTGGGMVKYNKRTIVYEVFNL